MGKEKKEIGKLLELLNEYEKHNVVNWYERSNDEGVLTCRYIKENFLYYCEEASTIATSKYYGFVERLVKNNKINFRGIPNIFTSIYAEKREDIYYEIEHNNYSVLTEQYGVEHTNRLLMLLSISSSPIEDLLLYLK